MVGKASTMAATAMMACECRGALMGAAWLNMGCEMLMLASGWRLVRTAFTTVVAAAMACKVGR